MFLTQEDVGAEISAVYTYTDNAGNDESVTSAPTSAVENVNDAPTGAVTISGIAKQGETLTANTDAVQDADGIDESTESGQWMRGGTPIPGATGESYTLTADDVGQVITAVYSYTDNFGSGRERHKRPNGSCLARCIEPDRDTWSGRTRRC